MATYSNDCDLFYAVYETLRLVFCVLLSHDDDDDDDVAGRVKIQR